MNNIIDTDRNYLEELEAKDIIIKDFRKLKAFELSLLFYKECLAVINKFPRSEQYILSDQLRRSSQGVVAQIAEGNANFYKKREIQFVSIATGSLVESQAHLDIALISGYITEDEHRKLDSIAVEIKKLLVVYVRSLLEEKI
ncbi:four helix bundle protein [Clostridium paraputrificum]|uniref:four helix bundle protein n=1 Tax=Clostridium paraputrificum TaxID=29363 RepID=UPI00232FAE30|nr:four helix bundle protein [Clostridium paraputrificum]MDB2102633.1 four helix bundle protein [Clostridium paraputrificum]